MANMDAFIWSPLLVLSSISLQPNNNYWYTKRHQSYIYAYAYLCYGWTEMVGYLLVRSDSRRVECCSSSRPSNMVAPALWLRYVIYWMVPDFRTVPARECMPRSSERKKQYTIITMQSMDNQSSTYSGDHKVRNYMFVSQSFLSSTHTFWTRHVILEA